MTSHLANKESEQADTDAMTVPDSSARSFMNPSILLFLDQLLVGLGGWAYWLAIPRFTNPSEIGFATTIYSLTIIITTLAQLGLEYPLLKKSQGSKSRIFGTALTIELAISIATIPLIFYLMNSYGFSGELVWMAMALVLLNSIGFVSRFALLGMSDAKTVLIYDSIGICVKFASGIVLVASGYGAMGILLSFVLSIGITSAGTLLHSARRFTLKIGNTELTKEAIRDSLINLPSKLSRMFILSMSILLLASFGITSAETGVFYVAVMITIAVAGFASSMAFMSIPASSQSKVDVSSGSLRLGLSYTAPIVAALIVAPHAVLSIIGPEYVSAATTLVILSIGVIPSVVVSNIISKLNTSRRYKELVLVGSVQLCVFLILFQVLVPNLNSEGASYAISISSAVAAFLALLWLDKTSRKHVLVSVVSVAVGSVIGISLSQSANIHPIVSIVVSAIVSLSIIFKLRNTSVRETKHLIQTLRNR